MSLKWVIGYFSLWGIGNFCSLTHLVYTQKCTYNGSIFKFYYAYPGRKRIITNSALQNKFSLVCGAYVIYVAFMLSTNRSLCTTFSKFSSNTCKNDRFVVRFLYNVASIVLSCNDNLCTISNV